MSLNFSGALQKKNQIACANKIKKITCKCSQGEKVVSISKTSHRLLKRKYKYFLKL